MRASNNNAISTPRNVAARHVDPNPTGEGLGSHARGTLYPLIRVALAMEWSIVWHHPISFGQGNHRSAYEEELKDLGEWLGLPDDEEYEESLRNGSVTEINIDLVEDSRLGRILGYAGILIDSIQAYIDENGADGFYGDNWEEKEIIVTLRGRFYYQDDPTPPVIGWLQQRSLVWQEREVLNSTHSRVLRIAVHIRVPEDYCSQEWKDANDVAHTVKVLKRICRLVDQLQHLFTKELKVEIDVYTEENFPFNDEEHLRRVMWKGGECRLRIHRQTPLLSTVQSMATADIFVPASSYLSALTGFFQTSCIFIPNEPTRMEKFLKPHIVHHHAAAGRSLWSPPCVLVSDYDDDDDAASRVIGRLLDGKQRGRESSESGSAPPK